MSIEDLAVPKVNEDASSSIVDAQNTENKNSWGTIGKNLTLGPSIWDHIPVEPDEEKLSPEEQEYQKHEQKTKQLFSRLGNADFLTPAEVEQCGDDQEKQKALLAQKVASALELINPAEIEAALNSSYKYSFMESSTQFHDRAVSSKDSFLIREKLDNVLRETVIKNPAVLDIREFLQKSEKDPLANGVTYNGKQYYPNMVIEGSSELFLIAMLSQKINGLGELMPVVNENLRNVKVDDLIENHFQYKKSLAVFDVFGDRELKNNYDAAIVAKMQSGNEIDARTILNSESSYVKSYGEKIAKDILKREFGLDNFDLDAWRQEGGLKYNENLNLMRRMESEMPLSVRDLNTMYGITEFHRYPIDALLAQAKEEDIQQPYGLVIFPREDHNSAFDQQKQMFERLYLETRGHYGLKISECGSKYEVGRQFVSLDKKYGEKNKIGFLVLGGHGTDGSIALGSYDPDAVNEIGNNPTSKNVIWKVDTEGAGFKKANERFLDTDAEVVFISCSTGKEGGIASAFSNSFDRKISGPIQDVSTLELGVTYGPNGKPHLKVSYNNDKTLAAQYGGKKNDPSDEEKIQQLKEHLEKTYQL